MAGAAFFDLDRTLLLVNSASAWFRWERAGGRLALRHAVEAAMWMGLYRFGLMEAGTALGRAVATLAGESETELARRTAEFFREEIEDHIAPGGLRALDRHRHVGEPLVLLTSATRYLADCLGDHMVFDGVLCNRLEVVDDRFTGRLLEPVCFGAGKVHYARAWAEERGLSLAESAFYTDSITDLPMLEAVGRPVAVQPDPRLLRLAKKRGWTVEDWTR